MTSVQVGDGVTATRLDVFLHDPPFGLSRRSAQRAIADGQVWINQRRARKSQSVVSGDVVTVDECALEPPIITPEGDLGITIAYEDSHVVVLDKPSAMPTHPVAPEDRGTAANFLVARYPETASIGDDPREAGLVHRLDNDTSGLLVAARNQAAYDHLRQQFRRRLVIKEYTVLVHGVLQEEKIVSLPIAHDRRHRSRMKTTSEDGRGAREATTEIRPIERVGRYTLLAVRIKTGVRHQIRVHLASIGHPVVGDLLYGERRVSGARRHLLHACYIVFDHPSRRERIDVRSGLPEDYTKLVQRLRYPPRQRPAKRR